ncbi:MAG: hypothetical protein NW224_06485 [Leptolyngbyaceae cyanobacterium bins.302]|nr:hypothetical protein [Leptolyngbyaceae cyanobacterium bins.302]
MDDFAIKLRSTGWLNWLAHLLDNFRRQNQIHDYSKLVNGIDYVFEQITDEKNKKGYMTAQKRGVKKGDRVLLMQDGKTREYNIQDLTYYSSPNDMWIAVLVRLDE